MTWRSGARVRVAAVGDPHLGADNGDLYREHWEQLGGQADMLLVAGDLTKTGTVAEGQFAAAVFGQLPVPVVAVLGNHDYHSGRCARIIALLRECGVTVLDGQATVLEVRGRRVGIAGTVGFGGGFVGKSASAFGETEMKLFVRRTERQADALKAALRSLDSDARIALTHYAPTSDTLAGEPPEIHPFLGSYQLGEAIDSHAVDLAIHGHAHFGSQHGATLHGTPVRNAATSVIGRAFAVYELPGL
nr:metallophosphoesterase [Sciscionella sp. SE31]